MDQLSVDKCSGDDCACNLKEVTRVITDLKVESVSLTMRPSIFPPPGGGQMIWMSTMPPSRDQIALAEAIRTEVEFNRRYRT